MMRTERTELLESMKTALTISHLLARFDSSKTGFIKTDWSEAGMGFILMQPNGSEASMAAMATLKAGEDNDFYTAIPLSVSALASAHNTNSTTTLW
jgi:hypothetical protein